MPNVGAYMKHKWCSTGCPHPMWCLGLSCFKDMPHMGLLRKHLHISNRCGNKEAEDFIDAMSCAPDASVWTTLLGACRIHGNVEMAERITKKIVC
jgi:hypothetical protein